MRTIKINPKKIRAKIIKEYLGNRRAFCFSCGNDTRWLKRAGVNLIPIDGKTLLATTEISPEQGEFYFNAFNATSGYLPLFLISRIADQLKTKLGKLDPKTILFVPLGSGELALALSFIHPANRIVALSSQRFPPTEQGIDYPLKSFLRTNLMARLKDNKAKNIKDLKAGVESCANQNSIFIDTSDAEK